MQRNSPVKVKVTLKTKMALVIFGVFLFFVILEAGLRLGGFVLLSIQEYRNRQTIKQKDTYRIMCLGESTTANQYPPFIEEILNQRNIGIKFSVIDKGIPGTTTSDILALLDSDINNYHPDMVVTMMGINDWGEHIPYEIATTSKTVLFFRSLKTYKLIRLLWLHILTKKNQTYPPGIGLKEAYIEPASTEDSLKKAIALNPEDDDAYAELGWFYRYQGKFSQAESSLKKAIALNPKNDRAYFGLGRFYRDQDKLSQAEDAFKKAIALNPKNVWAYTELVWLYRDQGKLSQAEDSLKKAIELEPKNDLAYRAILALYEEIGKPELAKEYAKKANTVRLKYYNPVTASNYLKLKEILDQRGIRLVCAQYPMRSIEPLKKIFGDNGKGVFFVDNEKIFRDAVMKSSSRIYFIDMFGGDFGHCTPKGNRLLAENIADVVLKEVFGK